MRTDRLDCCLLHWRGSVPLHETIAAFETLLRHGKILSWGASNFDVVDLDEMVLAHVIDNAAAAALRLSETELRRSTPRSRAARQRKTCR